MGEEWAHRATLTRLYSSVLSTILKGLGLPVDGISLVRTGRRTGSLARNGRRTGRED